MKGALSQTISGISLWLAVILLVIGLAIGKIEMAKVLFGLFVLLTIFILMQIFRFSTYHKYFPKMLPVLIGYGALVGYLLHVLNFAQYFIWFILLTIGFLAVNFRKQHQTKAIISLAESDEQKKLLEKSVTNTAKFHLLSTVTYIVASVGSFLLF